MKILKKLRKLLRKPIAFAKDSNIAVDFLGKTSRKELTLYFQERNSFYKRKTPNSEQYPYTVLNPYDVFKNSKGYEKLFLVGDNWLDSENKKPIALLIGFNNWKYGFSADYLKEYRVVFSSRQMSNLTSFSILNNLNPKPNVLIVWGYTENLAMRYYSKNQKIPIYRMEDGFIRSALLGASHATPYSLILDTKGLYYNPENESDLESILNNYDFDGDSKLLEEAKNSLELIVNMKISKYNTPSTSNFDKLGIKIKKRVVVLGQVDNDAAIRYGNLDNWSSEELVKLAKYENPEAEVLYRPHPEVYKGYQSSKFRRKKIEYFATVVSPEEPLLDFLETIDHVYVINSLSGLEALLRGIKVTTVGAAFYAGWGLTDDRCTLNRRSRKLSLLELFAGVYLKYPRYLANSDTFNQGLLTACYKIKADYEIAKFDFYKKTNIEESNILSSVYWVQHIFNTNKSEDGLNELFEKIDFTIYLKNGVTPFFQKIYILSLFGMLTDNKKRAAFLRQVRIYIDFTVYDEFLNIVSKVYEEELLVKEIAWLLKQNATVSKKLFELFDTKKNQYTQVVFESTTQKVLESFKVNQLDIDTLQVKIKDELNTENYENVLNILNILSNAEIDNLEHIKRNIEKDIFDFYEFFMNEKEFDKALRLAEIMLSFGLNTQTMLSKLTNYAKLRFDFEAVTELSKLNQNINLYAQNRNMSLIEMNSYSSPDIQRIGEEKFNVYLSKLITLKPNTITSAGFIIDKYKNTQEKEKLVEILESILYLDNEQSIRKAQAYIAINQAEKAVSILENLIETQDTTPMLICAYTQALSFGNSLDMAIEQIEFAIKKYIHKDIYQEAIRLYILDNKYKKCLNILSMAKSNNVELGEMYLRKTYFGNRMLKQAFSTFQDIPITQHVKQYFKDKYYNLHLEENNDIGTISILSIFGPGDEIRFASIYNLLMIKVKLANKIIITCSPKLFDLFQRSFPNILFIASEKLRDADFDSFKEVVKTHYSNVPGFDLLRCIDNNAMRAIEKSDKIIMVTDLLHSLLPNYDSFSGVSYLEADKLKIDEYKTNLPNNTKLIGLSWRSSLTTHSRNEHYLTIEELSPLFEIDGITFVNFQYDECSDELAWVEEKYPGKMIDVKELDHYDDLDSVAALMKCMDLMIAPATTVVELSGALGCSTWMFSNSSEIDWRKIDNEGTDVWHNSIKIVEGDIIGDKVSLVKNLKIKLDDFIGK